MKITDVEAIILRQPALDDGIADGSQDDLVIRIHTDEGIVGIGEVDSAPGGRAARSSTRRSSHAIAERPARTCCSARTRSTSSGSGQKMYRGIDLLSAAAAWRCTR